MAASDAVVQRLPQVPRSVTLCPHRSFKVSAVFDADEASRPDAGRPHPGYTSSPGAQRGRNPENKGGAYTINSQHVQAGPAGKTEKTFPQVVSREPLQIRLQKLEAPTLTHH